MKNIYRITLLVIGLTAGLLLAGFLKYLANSMAEKPPVQEKITWGVDFSQAQAEHLGLDWKQLYLAVTEELGAKNIKLHTQWGASFDDIDWQIKQAEKNNAKIIYVLGLKTGRWPECHMPEWAKTLEEKSQKTEILKHITETVMRYKDSKAIEYWQVENEPLFKFGQCPNWYYKNDGFLKTEVALVKSLDPSREVIISDSGEKSDWQGASKIGDIVGVTMYRNAWSKVVATFGFNSYSFLTPSFYYDKAQKINRATGKKVICIELQSEPWASKPIPEASLQEQFNSMNLEMFKENIRFAKETGFDTFYFWGAEWWYWLKEKHGDAEIWNEAQKLFIMG